MTSNLICDACGHKGGLIYDKFPAGPKVVLGAFVVDTRVIVPAALQIAWCDSCARQVPQLRALSEHQISELLVNDLLKAADYDEDELVADKSRVLGLVLDSRKVWSQWLRENQGYATACECGSKLSLYDPEVPKVHRGCGGKFEWIDSGLRISWRRPVSVRVLAYDLVTREYLKSEDALSLLTLGARGLKRSDPFIQSPSRSTPGLHTPVRSSQEQSSVGPISRGRPGRELTTVLHGSPFHLLSVSMRDDRRKIVAEAEEQALHLDAETCQKARSDLTNPRTRLSAELAWLPGLSPNRASSLVETLKSRPWDIRQEDGLPALAKANLLAAASEAVDAEFSSEEVSDFIHDFALLVDDIDPEDVLRSINEDRAVSGFPEVRDIDLIEAEIAERKRYYRNAIKAALNRLNSPELVATMTMVVENATLDGEVHAPDLIDELVDAYAVETQGVLSKESQNADRLIRAALESAKAGEAAVRPLIDKLESVARTWDKIAQPIQLSSKARGLEHEPSKELAYSIRSLAIDLFNEHDLLVQAQRLTKLLSELFSELPEFVERVSADTQSLSDIARQRQKSEREQRQWEEEIAFSADVGMVFKDNLAISAKGISWKEKTYPLESITRVRWGGVRHSVNGIPSGTDYTVAFGDNRTESVVSIKREATYTKFTEKLWRAVCVRLMTDILRTMKNGSEVQFGEAAVRDDGITLIKHKFLGSNEAVRYPWSQVQIWSADGAVVIGAKDDKKAYASLSYIQIPNAHILEQIIRIAFKKAGFRRLSDLLG